MLGLPAICRPQAGVRGGHGCGWKAESQGADGVESSVRGSPADQEHCGVGEDGCSSSTVR